MSYNETMVPLYTRDGRAFAKFRTDDKGNPYILEQDRCIRCGGSGIFHIWGSCFRCGGGGREEPRKVKLYTAEKNAKLDAAAEKRRAKAAEKRAAKKAERDAEISKIRAEFLESNPEVPGQLEAIAGTEFGGSLADAMERWGCLSEAQVKALGNAAQRAAQRAKEDAESAPVVEGRIELSGRVLSTKEVHNHFGSTIKMLFRDDSGFKVWGSVPRNLLLAGCDRGSKIRFTATVERSDDDETFGFFKRPAKAELAE